MEDSNYREVAAYLSMQEEGELVFQALTGREISRCPEHGYQFVSSGHNSGFAGEGFSWMNYACGCTVAESGTYHDQ